MNVSHIRSYKLRRHGLVHQRAVPCTHTLHVRAFYALVLLIFTLFTIFIPIQYGNLPELGKSERMGKLYGRIFLKTYPQLGTDSFTVCLDDLLSWPYWANFIKIYSMLS